MKAILTAILISSAALVPLANAQPARIDYSKQDAGWMDQSGAPSVQMGYDGVTRRVADGASDRQATPTMARDPNLPNANRRKWRDTRADTTWNQSVHNGYYARNNQWQYGQPNARQMRQPGFAMGYRPWTRGQRLGSDHQNFAAVDYRARKLSPPPRGYHWVEDDRGDYLLAAIVGGLIARVVVNSPR